MLDAFAGRVRSGLETLSRGAPARTLLRARRRGAARAVRQRARAQVGGAPRAIHRGDVLRDPPAHARPPFSLVFLDPPYALAAQDALGLAAPLAADGALAPDALVAYEHGAGTCGEADAAAAACGLALASRKKYGDTVVDLFRPKEL